MKKIDIAGIILTIVALFFFFKLPFGPKEVSSTIEEESPMLTEDLEKKNTIGI